jgi:hypothetical protein
MQTAGGTSWHHWAKKLSSLNLDQRLGKLASHLFELLRVDVSVLVDTDK